MGVGVTEANPLTSMRALIRIEQIKVEDSPFEIDGGGPQMQFRAELKALKGAGERDGETFGEFFTFPASGQIKATTKTGQVVNAALRGDGTAETLEELAEKLEGKMFVAQITTSKNGEYSRVKHDTISPAPEPKQKQEPEPEPPEPAQEDEDDFSDIPF